MVVNDGRSAAEFVHAWVDSPGHTGLNPFRFRRAAQDMRGCATGCPEGPRRDDYLAAADVLDAATLEAERVRVAAEAEWARKRAEGRAASDAMMAAVAAARRVVRG